MLLIQFQQIDLKTVQSICAFLGQNSTKDEDVGLDIEVFLCYYLESLAKTTDPKILASNLPSLVQKYALRFDNGAICCFDALLSCIESIRIDTWGNMGESSGFQDLIQILKRSFQRHSNPSILTKLAKLFEVYKAQETLVQQKQLGMRDFLIELFEETLEKAQTIIQESNGHQEELIGLILRAKCLFLWVTFEEYEGVYDLSNTAIDYVIRHPESQVHIVEHCLEMMLVYCITSIKSITIDQSSDERLLNDVEEGIKEKNTRLYKICQVQTFILFS